MKNKSNYYWNIIKKRKNMIKKYNTNIVKKYYKIMKNHDNFFGLQKMCSNYTSTVGKIPFEK